MNAETTINDRIQQVILHYRFNKNSFSKAIGLSNSMTISNIVGGRRSKPGYDILWKIASRFPISPRWLLMGKGEMLLDAKNDTHTGDVKILDDKKLEMDKLMEVLLLQPEKFEKHPIFAKYIESKCDKAIIAYQNRLLLDFREGSG